MYIGTLLFTWLKGRKVGADEFGNRYYLSKGRRLQGRERRWVLYKGPAEASKVPPEWHAWLNHTTDAPLSEKAAQARPWLVIACSIALSASLTPYALSFNKIGASQSLYGK